jgi:hypothetical protein
MSAPSMFDPGLPPDQDVIATGPVPIEILVASPFTWRRPTPVLDVLEFTDGDGRVFHLRGGAVSRLGAALDGLQAAHNMAGRFPDEGKFK